MPDSNKVMRGLQFCEYEYCETSDEDCPYKRENNCKQKLIRDTIEEIKQLKSITAIRKGRQARMKNFDEMTVKELCELSQKNQVKIAVRFEPDGCGKINTTLMVHPWKEHEPFCPHGTPIVYVKGKEDE